MDSEQTSQKANGLVPLSTPMVNEECTNTTTYQSIPQISGEQDEDHSTTRHQYLSFATPGPTELLLCLLLNMTVTCLWYYLNIDMPAAGLSTISPLYRHLFSITVLVPTGLFSLLECLFCFGTLLCVRHQDQALCIARVALGCMLGASFIVKYGLGAGVLDGGNWTDMSFWAVTGILPGAGLVALVGFCWDFMYWGWPQVDEEIPLLEKEHV
jgi:hypothetical protein